MRQGCWTSHWVLSEFRRAATWHATCKAQTLVQLHAPEHLRGRLIGLFNMSNNGLRAFSGVTVGIVGGLIGIHWSLALSALLLLTATIALLAFTVRGRGPARSHP